MRYREDYAAADVPMLPVVRSAAVVGRQIMVYAVLTVAASLLLWPVAGTGWLYLDRGPASPGPRCSGRPGSCGGGPRAG